MVNRRPPWKLRGVLPESPLKQQGSMPQGRRDSTAASETHAKLCRAGTAQDTDVTVDRLLCTHVWLQLTLPSLSLWLCCAPDPCGFLAGAC